MAKGIELVGMGIVIFQTKLFIFYKDFKGDSVILWHP
jgi:hypothetical protein